MSAVIITETNFKNEVELSDIPVLLDFRAYRGNDQSRGTDLGSELEGRFKVGTVNVNDEPDIAYRYKIRKIPTMLLIKDGRVTDTIVGNLSKTQILGIIE